MHCLTIAPKAEEFGLKISVDSSTELYNQYLLTQYNKCHVCIKFGKMLCANDSFNYTQGCLHPLDCKEKDTEDYKSLILHLATPSYTLDIFTHRSHNETCLIEISSLQSWILVNSTH
jgi:hypothetical protein